MTLKLRFDKLQPVCVSTERTMKTKSEKSHGSLKRRKMLLPKPLPQRRKGN